LNVDIDRDELITVNSAKVIGESDSYRGYLASKGRAGLVCNSAHLGIELHTQLKSQRAPPITIKDVVFSGFSHMNCADALPFTMDGSVRLKCVYRESFRVC
jgi:hypothetical protein